MNDDYSLRIENAIKNKAIKKIDFKDRKRSFQKANSFKAYSDTESEMDSKKINEGSAEGSAENTHVFFKSKKGPDSFLKVKKREVKRRNSIQIHFDPTRNSRRMSKWFTPGKEEGSHRSASRHSGSIFAKSRMRTNESRKSSFHAAAEEIAEIE